MGCLQGYFVLWVFELGNNIHDYIVHTCAGFYLHFCKNFPKRKNNMETGGIFNRDSGLCHRCNNYRNVINSIVGSEEFKWKTQVSFQLPFSLNRFVESLNRLGGIRTPIKRAETVYVIHYITSLYCKYSTCHLKYLSFAEELCLEDKIQTSSK